MDSFTRKRSHRETDPDVENYNNRLLVQTVSRGAVQEGAGEAVDTGLNLLKRLAIKHFWLTR